MSIVLTFGTFDNFHPGHASYLTQAFSLADELLVIIARDENVERIKGRAPRRNELIRKKGVEKFLKRNKIKGQVYLGYKNGPLRVIARHRPDYIALGYDQVVDENMVRVVIENIDLKTEIVRLRPYHPEKFKSSILLSNNF